ncbi:DUF3466 family protein [Kangiella sp. HZ709]|uniref:DUF3466 family protein n=1 Tax=Kangiella sp. HZ709 TaxID=2666328 RepID=UPI0012B0FA13|nr:DUF3466 family protein [Kangiella sp. HZ709]MRX26987.1 DUF3466 family protein [Kangiella sp. HZ709]
MKKTILAKTLIATAITFSIGTVAAAPYDVIELGDLGGEQSFGWGVNLQGDVVGYANGPLLTEGGTEREFNLHAFSFTNSVISDLGAFGENNSFAFKINDSGLIIGYGFDIVDVDGNDSLQEFALTFPSSGPEKLDLGDGVINSRAINLNNANQIVGFGVINVAEPDGTEVRAFRGYVHSDTGVEFLPPFGDDQGTAFDAYATAINDSGVVVGWSEFLTERNSVGAKALIYNFSSEILEVPAIGGFENYPTDINNNNIVVGRAQDEDGFFRAFVYDLATETMTELPYINSSFRDAVANAVNDNGQVVGNTLASPLTVPKYAGFLYSEGQFQILNDLVACDSGWDLQLVNDISNSGEIVGVGIYEGDVRAFKLVPTGDPIEDCSEPDSDSSGGAITVYGLLSLFGLLMFRRRKM